MDWSEVAASPYSFRDAAVIGEVIDDIVATATREAAGHALAAVVKALEDEPVPGWQAWIARRLPELVFALAQPESSLAGVDSVLIDRAPAIIHELASTSSPDIRPTIAKCLRDRDSPRRRALLERIGGYEA